MRWARLCGLQDSACEHDIGGTATNRDTWVGLTERYGGYTKPESWDMWKNSVAEILRLSWAGMSR